MHNNKMILTTYLYEVINDYANVARIHLIIPTITIERSIFKGIITDTYPNMNSVIAMFPMESYYVPKKVTEMSIIDPVNVNTNRIEHAKSIEEFKNTILPSQLRSLRINMAGLNTLPLLPPQLKKLNCSRSLHILSIPSVPNTLKELDCSMTMVVYLPELPDTLTILQFSRTSVHSLNSLPSYLTILDCSYTKIRHLPELPLGLKRLTTSGCNINILPILPPTLLRLVVDSCCLTSIPDLPSTLELLRCINNKIVKLPSCDMLKHLECSHNPIIALPTLSDRCTVIRCFQTLIEERPIRSNCLIEHSYARVDRYAHLFVST